MYHSNYVYMDRRFILVLWKFECIFLVLFKITWHYIKWDCLKMDPRRQRKNFWGQDFRLCRSHPSEKVMAPHSSTLAWKIPWTEEPGGLQSMGRKELETTERLHFPFSLSCTGEGNGNPLQYSCLENPRDRGARWAAVYGVAQSQTRLKRRSSSSSRSHPYLSSTPLF